jgi:hypothetical protein
MNRRNYTVHIALAAGLVLLAAVAGQVQRWESRHTSYVLRQRVTTRGAKVQPAPPKSSESFRGDADVLVRFRAGVSEERVREIAARLGDRVEDEIESVSGLAAIDDLDGVTAEQAASEYAALPEVEYAEPNFEIRAEPLEAESVRARFVAEGPAGGPNDPLLSEQWGLINTGQREGTAGADVAARAAW